MSYKKRFEDYELKLINSILNLGGYEGPSIWSRWHNTLENMWFRNYKEIIKVETLMSIPVNYYGKPHRGNYRFDITPKQAEEIIQGLQKVLKNRKSHDI